jgi:hypothetical protein
MHIPGRDKCKPMLCALKARVRAGLISVNSQRKLQTKQTAVIVYFLEEYRLLVMWRRVNLV